MKGQTLSHYRVLEVVGQGASGIVYRAEDLALGRLVALKCLPSDLPGSGSAKWRFQHEARTASAINHPNICTIYEIAEHDGLQFIVMEWLEGRTLADAIDRRPLKLEQLLDYAIEIADGLNAAHEQGVVHRDLKPANIFITTQRQAKILDFGISLVMPSPSSSSTQLAPPIPAGTAPYMSPEQVLSDDLDPRSDLFSLGIVLYEMATGRRPFVAGTVQEIKQLIVDQSPSPPRIVNPDIPSDLDRIVMKALEKNRKLRYQTASDIRVDLQRLKRDFDSGMLRTPSVAVASPQPQRQPPKRFWLKPAAAGLGVAALTIAVMGAVANRRSNPVSLNAAAGPLPAAATSPITPAIESNSSIVASSTASPGLTAPAAAPAVTTPRKPEKVAVAAAPVPLLPVNVEVSAGSDIETELGIARQKTAAGLHAQALETVRNLLVRHAAAPEAVDAYFLMASIQEAQSSHADAMATYLEIVGRFKTDQRSAEALYRYADLTLKSKRGKKEIEARNVLTQLVDGYPKTSLAPRALMMKARVEEEQRLYERDAVLGTAVPSALITYRRLLREYPEAAGNEIALLRLAEMYEEAKRFDLAATSLVDLATRYPVSYSDAWFRAAELYRRRLKDEQTARNAYARVPATSRHFRDAQNRLK
jgi:serine/threonine protein kinase